MFVVARNVGDHARVDEIEEEMAFLTKAMEGGKGLRGRQRRAECRLFILRMAQDSSGGTNMRSATLIVLALITLTAHAEEKRIFQVDPYGRAQPHKPSYTIQDDGRIIETDPLGKKRYDKPQYLNKGGRVYQTDPYGRIQYDKPGFVTH